MDIKKQIQADLIQAMKNKDKTTTSTLKMLKAEIQKAELEEQSDSLPPESIQAILVKMVKMRKESIEQFKSAGRDDLVATEESELKVLESYLPPSPSKQEYEEAVTQAVADIQPSSMKDMGATMDKAREYLSNFTVDNKILSGYIRQKIQAK